MGVRRTLKCKRGESFWYSSPRGDDYSRFARKRKRRCSTGDLGAQQKCRHTPVEGETTSIDSIVLQSDWEEKEEQKGGGGGRDLAWSLPQPVKEVISRPGRTTDGGDGVSKKKNAE